MNPEKYTQNLLYMLDTLIFANNIVQSHNNEEEEEDVCVCTFMRRKFTAFIRFSKGIELQNSSEIRSNVPSHT